MKTYKDKQKDVFTPIMTDIYTPKATKEYRYLIPIDMWEIQVTHISICYAVDSIS